MHGATQAEHPAPTLDGRLKDLLAGRKILLTGVTGFIGEQLLWKILNDLPDTSAAVLVRRKGSASARDRMISVVKKKIFRDLAEPYGGPEGLLDAKVTCVEGDLPNVPELPRDIDILVHCAGDVSFDPPIDRAFNTNLIGTANLIDRFLESCTGAAGELVRTPHYVHVSTAYTAGRRRGAIGEAPHANDIDYEAEMVAGLKIAAEIETQSRTADQLARFRKAAEREHRAAGHLITATDTERRRKEWVQQKLVQAGTERARSLGWTDAYTFTKALGEKVVADKCKNIRSSIVRPAIVESSIKHPYPGWIEGFKMAEPIILAYGRGELPEFPASPEAICDVVPCDYVVNATLAVAATEPKVGVCEYYHVSSGARNPMSFREFYGYVRDYFVENPLVAGERGAPALPQWQFPGAASIERFLSRSERGHQIANTLIRFAPRSERTRQAARDLDRFRSRIDFLREYLGLYNEYAQSELHFVDDNTLRLTRSLHPDDQATFGFDTGDFDWTEYILRIHIPSVVAPVRRLEALRRRRGNRSTTFVDLSRTKDKPGEVLAAFDLDGTVMQTNVIEQYLWTKLPDLAPTGKLRELATIAGKLPSYLRADRTDRGMFLRTIYRRYAGADLAALEEFVDTVLAREILSRLSPEAVRRAREHRAAGHTTVLITGAIRPLTRPLRPLFDVIVASDLATDANGICTGFLTGPPMVGESRAAWLNHYANLHGIDLSRSYAYADSHPDLAMLSVVGRPVVVSPDIALMRAASANGWSTVEWTSRSQEPRWTRPLLIRGRDVPPASRPDAVGPDAVGHAAVTHVEGGGESVGIAGGTSDNVREDR
ncbi:HAD-IB family hydrolase [Microlunatus sp. Gsoil 973]|nr:HAD-IB family hydrolase [Microlunatus sp. Gsoil 973]